MRHHSVTGTGYAPVVGTDQQEDQGRMKHAPFVRSVRQRGRYVVAKSVGERQVFKGPAP